MQQKQSSGVLSRALLLVPAFRLTPFRLPSLHLTIVDDISYTINCHLADDQQKHTPTACIQGVSEYSLTTFYRVTRSQEQAIKNINNHGVVVLAVQSGQLLPGIPWRICCGNGGCVNPCFGPPSTMRDTRRRFSYNCFPNVLSLRDSFIRLRSPCTVDPAASKTHSGGATEVLEPVRTKGRLVEPAHATVLLDQYQRSPERKSAQAADKPWSVACYVLQPWFGR